MLLINNNKKEDKIMKKILIALGCVMLSISMTGCGSNDAAPAEKEVKKRTY